VLPPGASFLPRQHLGGQILYFQTAKQCRPGIPVLKAVSPIIAKGVTAKLIGKDGVEELSNIVSEDEKSINEFSGKATEEFLKLFNRSKRSISQFKKNLSGLIKQVTKNENISLPLFIFIDELDRCRPTFAVETLERIKHLFDVPEIVFIIATDTEQLSHSVKAIYGESFEGRVYLRRFFNQEYSLPDPSPIKFSEMLFMNFKSENIFFDYAINPTGEAYVPIHFEDKMIAETNEHTIIYDKSPNCDLIILFTMFSIFFSLDLRTQKQCYEKFEAVIINGKIGERFHSAYLFFLIALEAKKPSMFKEFFAGYTCSERERVLNKLGESPVNYRSNTELITVQKLIGIYLHYTLMTKKQLQDSLHNPSGDEFTSSIALGIFNNYKALPGYKSKVELVGALS